MSALKGTVSVIAVLIGMANHFYYIKGISQRGEKRYRSHRILRFGWLA
jgi:hypothetical protein